MTSRVWYLDHAESDCVLKVYSEDRAMHYVMYDGCVIIDYQTYKLKAKEYGQEI